MSEFATVKIGRNRGSRRIWIDGKRLLDAGFTGGSTYYCKVNRNSLSLCLQAGGVANEQKRKVTGRPSGKPIIDISGRTVDEAFSATVTQVVATFSDGRIDMAPATAHEAPTMGVTDDRVHSAHQTQ